MPGGCGRLLPVAARGGVGRGSQRERGAASLLALAFVGVIVMIGMGAHLVVAVAAAHRAAQGAADLTALAGADRWQREADPASACAAASAVAASNGAALLSCEVRGEDLRVLVRVEGPRMFGHAFEITGRARAGPG
ncbi:Rv3654c family TadE-like protein [Nocardioides daejeonensis]|uniref:Rv3654c family TadE-like protein n=1 Tax=Nocardioides daejeonensis TaxID=1046556 RepID=UPI000D74A183|nr:Rv3654c family TadE-like protein [Nocardioides daejeonensis]